MRKTPRTHEQKVIKSTQTALRLLRGRLVNMINDMDGWVHRGTLRRRLKAVAGRVDIALDACSRIGWEDQISPSKATVLPLSGAAPVYAAPAFRAATLATKAICFADISSSWCAVARKAPDATRWEWTIPESDVEVLTSARALGAISTAQRREAGDIVLLARRPPASPWSP